LDHRDLGRGLCQSDECLSGELPDARER